ncbi:MAG: ligase-associated DNA damage response endonuclease PdeM [Planctomycetota bacterium]
MKVLEIELCGEPAQLFPERALFLPSRSDLLVADLHFGKTESFRRLGIPLPPGQTLADLQRLEQLVKSCTPKRLVLLGDFTHAALDPNSPTHRELASGIHRLRHDHGLEVLLVRGNHDEHERELSDRLEIPAVLDERAGPFHYVHDPEASTSDLHLIGGHLHPGINLKDGRDRMFLPVFWVRKQSTVLPSFGGFTGKWPIKRARGDRLFAVGPDRVLEL